MTERRLLAATTNRGKLKEIQALLGPLSFTVLSLSDVPSMAAYEETGLTFAENARGKALYYSAASNIPTLGEDSGLEIPALGGRPGVYSARFAGPDATDDNNIDRVLELLSDVPDTERTARFVSCLALAEQGRILGQFRGAAEGRILRARRGEYGFGYDPIFFFPPLGKTFAELSGAEKNSVSHRGQALRSLLSFLK